MRTFIFAVALVGSCLAVPQTFQNTYEIPSGKVSFTSNVPVEGSYGQYYGGVQPAFRYGQAGVRPLYGLSQPAVKSVVAQPVKEVQSFGVQTVQDKYYGGYAQPAVRFNVPSKVVKPAVSYVTPATPVLNKYVAEARISQPVVQHVAPFVQHVSPVVHHVSPVAYPKAAYPVETPYTQSFEKFVKPITRFASPVVQSYTPVPSPVAYPKAAYPVETPYTQSFEKFVKPVTRFASPVVQSYTPVARFGQVSPFVPAVKYNQGVAPFTKYGQVASLYQHGVVAKNADSPAAILAQNQDTSVDGSFVANFQTENGIQSAVSGVVKPVPGSDEPAQVMSGSYSYTSPDGTPFITTWYADENGFHADGDHIPAVPEEIQRSLEYIHSLPVAQEELKYVK